jgi:hypothetical protein
LRSPEAKQRHGEVRALFAQSHEPRRHIEGAAPGSPGVHALPGRKGHGPRRHI